MGKIRIGAALCGSFCTFDTALRAWSSLAETGKYDLTPIFSETAYGTDTRFGTAADFIAWMETICGKPALHTIPAVEPIGPKAMLDALVVAPCTGNTLAKLACGVTDSAVTMACKAHLRNGRPLLLAVSTNDGLSGSAANLGALLGRKNVYFVPFRQDDPAGKPTSLVADYSLLEPALAAALDGRQLQPVLLGS